MGDRANVIVKTNDEQVCLYTHWGGEELPEVVKAGLIRGKSRWNDFQYLTRILFCEMIQSDVMGETGYGISQKEHDGEGGRVITIDCDEGTITIKDFSPIQISAYVNKESVSWDSPIEELTTTFVREVCRYSVDRSNVITCPSLREVKMRNRSKETIYR